MKKLSDFLLSLLHLLWRAGLLAVLLLAGAYAVAKRFSLWNPELIGRILATVFIACIPLTILMLVFSKHFEDKK